MNRTIKTIFFTLLTFIGFYAFGEKLEVKSPDGNLVVQIKIEEKTEYSILFKGKEIVHPSEISLFLANGITTGKNPRIKSYKYNVIDETIIPVVKEKRAEVRNHCNEIAISFRDRYSLLFRAYNDGVAWRWVTDMKTENTVVNELASFSFNENDSIYFPEEKSFLTHSERQYPLLAIKNITNEQMSCMPALVCQPDGTRIAITESDLLDYPGMYLTGSGRNQPVLFSKFPPYPLEETQQNDRTVAVTKGADYIAKTAGKRQFPWRVLIITDNDGSLIESDMVYKLATPNKLVDHFWIEPGKVAWDWWNALNIYGVDFKSGLNTATYKYYIDFAAAYKIPYIILDEGWSDTEDLLKVNPDINLDELLAYAKKKDVGIILWVVWLALDRQMDVALDRFQQWGVKGIKVDFMQRDDQKMVNYYERVAVEAAKRKLMVDFHGSYKPTGLRRTYPNIMTREGIHGLENNKWAKTVTPEHDVTIPFTRMLAGPMDYTPGAMLNTTQKEFQPVWDRPMSQGTRCHQLAMYVVYESPLQMLADNPSNYYKEPETMTFLEQVPVTWDDTKVLEAKVGDYVIIARKNGNKWYIGGMTDFSARQFEIPLNFITDGMHKITIWKDGVNADKTATDFKMEIKMLTPQDRIKVEMAPGGGWVAIIE